MHGEPRTSVVSAWQGRDSWRRQKTKLRRVEPCSIEGSKPPLTPILFLQSPAHKPSDDRFNRPQFPEAPSRFHVVGPMLRVYLLPSHYRRADSFQFTVLFPLSLSFSLCWLLIFRTLKRRRTRQSGGWNSHGEQGRTALTRLAFVMTERNTA